MAKQERPFRMEAKYDPMKLEESVRVYWEGFGVKQKLREARSEETIGYVEGPPTLNGRPHIGHLRGRMMKDIWHRHETMKGRKVLFYGGWDTQGLPVELEAEKELGLRGSKRENLKAVGEERLVEACKRLIEKYYALWVRADRLLGLQMDDENAYWTYRDEYIEREWQYLKAAHERGLLGEGYKVVPYCPSCQTSLSHAEVGLGYASVEDPSVYYKARLTGRDAYLVVWTTMPFTVVTDELVGVRPGEEYVLVDVEGEKWVVGRTRLDAMMKEAGIEGYREEASFRGAEMDGWRYVPPLLDEVSGQAKLFQEGKVHAVVAEEFVDPTTGSGIVHLSPANGEDDFEVARRRGMPVFNPLDDRAVFTGDAGSFAGLFVRDSDARVVETLRKKGLLVSSGRLTHEYPLCWRSDHRLVYVARREYFYWVDKIADLTTEAAAKAEYYYEPPRNRFLGIVGEGKPWNITRERVWGAPLPIWKCSKCSHKSFLWGREEIVGAASRLPDGPDFELHRPWIDRVVVRCAECGGDAYREPFVLDTWHNSGAAPFASKGREGYEARIPVPYLTEGIDQTRGWAYTLLIENVLLTGKAEAPFRAFLFQGLVLDENGEKMSKSRGNSVEWLDLLSKNSADLVRFYLAWKASPADPLRFSEKEMYGRPFQVLNTLYHLHLYYHSNSKYDGFAYPRDRGQGGALGPEDRWLLSKCSTMAREVGARLEARRYHEAARLLEAFVIETLSQQYVPMTRNHLWDDAAETRPRRCAIYTVLGEALEKVDGLVHPLAPFLTEYLHSSVFGQDGPLIFSRYPAPDGRADPALEGEFEVIWELLSLANSARMKAKVKRRWPLKGLLVHGRRLSPLASKILAELANVKEVEQVDAVEKIPAAVRLRLSREAARKLRKDFTVGIKEAERAAGKMYRSFSESGHAVLEVEGRAYSLGAEDLEFSFEPRDGFEVAYDAGALVAIASQRDEGLVAEGLTRDVARRLQSLRKERGYDPTEMVKEARVAGLDEGSIETLERMKDRLLHLVRAESLRLYAERPDGDWAESELDGRTIYLDV